MDNAVEALYMAASILIFMVALTITLSSFSTFRNDLEDLILSEERVDAASTTDSSGKTQYINYISGEDERRTVGIETVVNSLYRVYKENYIVVMKLNDYTKVKSDSDLKGLISFAKKKQEYPGVEEPIIKYDEFYPENPTKTDEIIIFALSDVQNDENFINTVLEKGLYDILKGKTFTEYAGIYYETDACAEDEVNDHSEPVSDVNKRSARIITYIEK